MESNAKVYEIRVSVPGVRPFRTLQEDAAKTHYQNMINKYGTDKVSYREEPVIEHRLAK